MKKCNKCHCTVDNEVTCPICKNDVTMEEYQDGYYEKYAFNKYTVKFFLSQLLPEFVAVILVTIRYTCFSPRVIGGINYVILLLIIGIVEALFARQLVCMNKYSLRFFNSDWSIERMESFLPISAYVCPVLACIIAVFT